MVVLLLLFLLLLLSNKSERVGDDRSTSARWTPGSPCNRQYRQSADIDATQKRLPCKYGGRASGDSQRSQTREHVDGVSLLFGWSAINITIELEAANKTSDFHFKNSPSKRIREVDPGTQLVSVTNI